MMSWLPLTPGRPPLSADIAEEIEISVKYEGYIRRQMAEVAEFARLEHRAIPEDIDYAKIDGLRLERAKSSPPIRTAESGGRRGGISGVESGGCCSFNALYYFKNAGLSPSFLSI